MADARPTGREAMTPDDTKPSAEALAFIEELRRVVVIPFGAEPAVALSLDRFRAVGVREERERCAAAIDCGGPNGCGEWIAKRGRGHKRGNGHCMAHEGYCAHDLAADLRGEEPSP